MAQLVAATSLPPFKAFTRQCVKPAKASQSLHRCNVVKMYGTVGTGNGNGYVLITVAVAKMLAALYGRKEDKSYDHWTETQVWLVARGSLLIFFFFLPSRQRRNNTFFFT